MWWCRHWKIPPTDPRADAPLYEMERWYMFEAACGLAASREKSFEQVEYEDVFGHDATSDPDTYAGIRTRMIEQAGGFANLDAKKLALIDEQARELAAKKRRK
jgi:hypothetical protein